MPHTYEELKSKTVAQLREIAASSQHEAVQGYTQLNKEHLLAAICKAFNIDMHEHHHVIGVNKSATKGEIKRLKGLRDEALESRDHKQLKAVRRRIHRLKRMMHKATV